MVSQHETREFSHKYKKNRIFGMMKHNRAERVEFRKKKLNPLENESLSKISH